MRGWRITAWVFIWVFVALAVLMLSARVHLDTPAAHEAGRAALAELVTGEMAGTLEVGRVTHLSPWKVAVEDARIYDPDGRLVIRGERLSAEADLVALRRGVLRFPRGHVEGGELVLYEGEDGLPSFLDAFGAASPSPPGTPPDPNGVLAIVDELRLDGLRVHGEVAGVRGIVIEDVSARLGLRIDDRVEDGVDVRIHALSGRVTGPTPFPVELESVRARITDDPTAGIAVHVVARTVGEDGAAGDRVAARFALASPRPAAEPELDLWVHLDPLRFATLAESGFVAPAEALRGALRGHVHVTGPLDALRARGWVRSDAGPIGLEGTLRLGEPMHLDLEARTGGLRLDALVDGAPALDLRGAVGVRLDDGEDPRVRASFAPFTYDDLQIPGGTVEGRLAPDALHIDRAALNIRGGELEASGSVGFDGVVDLHVRGDIRDFAADPTLRALVPGLRGGGRLDARLRIDGDEITLDAQGRWVFTRLRYGPLYVGALVATGYVRGDLRAPTLALGVDVRDVVLADLPLGSGSGRIDGVGPYAVGLALTSPLGPLGSAARRRRPSPTAAPDAVVDATETPSQAVAWREEGAARTARRARRIALDGRVDLRQGLRVDLGSLELAAGRERWTGSLRGLRVEGTRVELGALALASGAQRIQGSGRWQRRGEDTMRVEVAALDLARLRQLLRGWLPDTVPAVEGVLGGTATLGGDLERQPTLALDAQIAGGRFGAAIPGAMEGSLLLRYDGGRLDADVGAILEGAGEIEAHVQGTLDTDVRLRDAAADGAYELRARVGDVDLDLLTLLTDELPTLRGRASGSLRASGDLQVFDFEADLQVPALEVAPLPPLGARLHLAYAEGAFVARAGFDDEHGQLAEGEASVVLDLRSTLEDPSILPLLLDTAPWRVALRVPRRRLDRFPPALVEGFPGADKLEASATLTFRGGAYRPQGDLLANVAWTGSERRGCGDAARPRAAINARLRDGVTHADVSGFVGGEQVVWAEAHAPTPIATWLRDTSAFAPPPTRLDLWAIDVPSARLPVLCEHADGPITAALEVHNLFGARPRAELEVSSIGVVLRELATGGSGEPRVRAQTRPLDVGMRATLGGGALEADARISWWNEGRTTLRARLPMTWQGVELPIPSEDAYLTSRLTLDRTPLDAPLYWVDEIREPSGTLQGELAIHGPWRAPRFEGSVDILDGRLTIPAFGQRLEDVTGLVLFEGDRIAFQDVRARDGDGVAVIAGGLELEGLQPRRADLVLRAESFPVRQEGSVLARLTGSARLGTELQPDGLDGELVVDGLAVWLARDAGRTPQSLTLHPDIHVVGVDPEPADEGEPYAVRLRIDAREPFTVKGEDFAALLAAQLQLEHEGGLSLEGYVRLEAGHFDVFGKRFDVERGALSFDGGATLDPQVSLVANHELRSRPGELVSVTASGRLSEPSIRFSSTLTNDRAEIIALLISGDIRGDTAQEVERAPTDFLAGIAAGALTLTLREEFGQVVPTIALEGNRYGGTRIRGGWRLEELLPETIRRVIQGVYVEGFFNTVGADGTERRTVGLLDYGFRLELAFPRNIVNTNTFSPPDNFSLDVTWQP
ncbi:MAG: translocation/assembly module TamB domain-containing protein [Myxococcales bacterium]|nr:translocation/assembly module TamB domain-containing protein [Myxococcales bacterium]